MRSNTWLQLMRSNTWLQPRRSLAAAVVFALAVSSSAGAAVPTMVPVIGSLQAQGGIPAADGDYNLVLSLYALSSGGEPLWSEGPVTVTVKGGAFHWSLGSTLPLPPVILASQATVWLGVKVDADPEMPRKQLLSVPYSLHSLSAASLDCSGCVTGDMIDPAFLGGYAKLSGLSAVAKTGLYADLEGVPVAATVAATGSYADLTGKPTLVAVDSKCDAGLFVHGVAADGSLLCAAVAADSIEGDIPAAKIAGLTSPPLLQWTTAAANLGAATGKDISKSTTLTNAGGAQATGIVIAATGPFTVVNSCADTLAPGATCTATWTFAAGGPGGAQSGLGVASSAAGGSSVLILSASQAKDIPDHCVLVGAEVWCGAWNNETNKPYTLCGYPSPAAAGQYYDEPDTVMPIAKVKLNCPGALEFSKFQKIVSNHNHIQCYSDKNIVWFSGDRHAIGADLDGWTSGGPRPVVRCTNYE